MELLLKFLEKYGQTLWVIWGWKVGNRLQIGFLSCITRGYSCYNNFALMINEAQN
jgi:hypothetical protein